VPLRRWIGVVLAVAGLATASLLVGVAPANAAGLSADVTDAATTATGQGYRTGVAVLDLNTGQYYGAGEDTGSFASESVVKVMIATELLATGQLTGSTEQTAYRMITQSDDDAADALYGLAGGDDVINKVAARYHISDLGTPPSRAGWCGNTEINARAMVYLYAAIADDATVGPWLMDAMAHAAQYGADGTNQYFGIPSATSGAAIKQGWGDDGDDSPDAQFNSTGYVDDGRFAVAILTDGDPSTYGSAISAVVTAQARALMPGGHIATSAVATSPSSSAGTAGNNAAAAATAPSGPSSPPPVSTPAGLPDSTPAGLPDSVPATSKNLRLVEILGATILASTLAAGSLYRHRRRNQNGRRSRPPSSDDLGLLAE
jgi:hypothetical protein